jgi:hypothetical protein
VRLNSCQNVLPCWDGGISSCVFRSLVSSSCSFRISSRCKLFKESDLEGVRQDRCILCYLQPFVCSFIANSSPQLLLRTKVLNGQRDNKCTCSFSGRTWKEKTTLKKST